MSKPEFDWDDANISHIAGHGVTRGEAEQAILNRPVDIGKELRNGEERLAQIGETDQGRVLVAISTMVENRIRVVTAWPANKAYRRYFATLKRNGDVGRVEGQDIRE